LAQQAARPKIANGSILEACIVRRRMGRPVPAAGPCAGIHQTGESNAMEKAADFTFIARRNNSLSTGGRLLVVSSFAAVILAIALGFALNGVWLILPFAGLDFLMVYLAFRRMGQHAGDYECISVREDKLVISSRCRDTDRSIQFNPYWVQVVGGTRCGKDDPLILRSHGREVEFGIHLTGEQRAALARRLKEHLKHRR
jgi:uncharacterized membrane protein